MARSGSLLILLLALVAASFFDICNRQGGFVAGHIDAQLQKDRSVRRVHTRMPASTIKVGATRVPRLVAQPSAFPMVSGLFIMLVGFRVSRTRSTACENARVLCRAAVAEDAESEDDYTQAVITLANELLILVPVIGPLKQAIDAHDEGDMPTCLLFAVIALADIFVCVSSAEAKLAREGCSVAARLVRQGVKGQPLRKLAHAASLAETRVDLAASTRLMLRIISKAFPILAKLGAKSEIEEVQDIRTRITIVLVGATGAGKSTTANTLVGEDRFESRKSLNSVTATCSCKDFELGPNEIRIIDTPGFSDTRMSPEEQKSIYRQFTDLAPNGVHVFLYVIQFGRSTEENVSNMTRFEELHGEDVWDHTILVCTSAADVTKEDFDSDVKQVQAPRKLRQVREAVAEVVLIDNYEDKQDARVTLSGAIHILCRSQSRPYSNDRFHSAQEYRRQLAARVKRLPPSMEDMARDLLHQFDRGDLDRVAIEEKLRAGMTATRGIEHIFVALQEFGDAL